MCDMREGWARCGRAARLIRYLGQGTQTTTQEWHTRPRIDRLCYYTETINAWITRLDYNSYLSSVISDQLCPRELWHIVITNKRTGRVKSQATLLHYNPSNLSAGGLDVGASPCGPGWQEAGVVGAPATNRHWPKENHSHHYV